MIPARVAAVSSFLRENLFYPLALSTALCAVLIGGRVVLSNTRSYGFLVWNLFLAWLPYCFALRAVAVRQSQLERPWRVALPALLWLLFLPNAPYIMTDFNHLLHLRSFPLMYDIILIFAFAWTGLLLGITSLYLIQRLVRDAWGRAAAGAVVCASTLLTAVGIYVGRFLRWNSWDVLARPGRIVSTLTDAIADPFSHTHAVGHTLVFATTLLLCYLTFLAFRDAIRK